MFVAVRQTWGQDRVFLLDEDGMQWSLLHMLSNGELYRPRLLGVWWSVRAACARRRGERSSRWQGRPRRAQAYFATPRGRATDPQRHVIGE
ncbi:MAG: Y4bD/Y4pK family protein [Actinomycetota bacterium]|nr:Y4bD/Y4pK family protein [Actinomycetota bacterium]